MFKIVYLIIIIFIVFTGKLRASACLDAYQKVLSELNIKNPNLINEINTALLNIEKEQLFKKVFQEIDEKYDENLQPVLIILDDPIRHETISLKERLEKKGFKVHSFSNFKLANEFYSNNRVDIVFIENKEYLKKIDIKKMTEFLTDNHQETLIIFNGFKIQKLNHIEQLSLPNVFVFSEIKVQFNLDYFFKIKTNAIKFTEKEQLALVYALKSKNLKTAEKAKSILIHLNLKSKKVRQEILNLLKDMDYMSTAITLLNKINPIEIQLELVELLKNNTARPAINIFLDGVEFDEITLLELIALLKNINANTAAYNILSKQTLENNKLQLALINCLDDIISRDKAADLLYQQTLTLEAIEALGKVKTTNEIMINKKID